MSSRARLGLLLVALSFGFVLLAAVVGFQGIGAVFGVVLVWCAVASQLVGIAYFTGEPNVFGKRRDGSLPLARRIVFGPYLVVAKAIAWLLPRLFHTRDHDEVAPGILLGRWVSPVPAHVTTVLDLTAELPRIPGGTAEYLPLPTLDGTAPDPRSVVLAVRTLADRDGAILLHCAAGHGRSAMVAGALLVQRGVVATAEEAEAHLRRHRPGVSLSRDQRQALARVIDLLRAPP